MRCTRFAVTLAAVMLAAASAWSISTDGYSGSLTSFYFSLQTRRGVVQTAADGGDKSAKAELVLLDAIGAAVTAPAAKASYASEMKTAASIAKTLEKRLPAETSLDADLFAGTSWYEPDLGAARTSLANLVAALSGAPAAKAKKRLAKADKALKAADAATAASKPHYVYLAQLAAAAKVLSPSVHGAVVAVRGEPKSVAVDSTGQYVYVAEFGDTFDSGTFAGDVRELALYADGTVGDVFPPSVPAGLRPVGVVASPKAGFVYVGNSGEATVSQFSIGSGGRLVPLAPPTVTLPAGTGVAAIAIDGSGQFVFTIGFGSGGSPVTSWKIGADGTLSPVNTLYTTDFPTSIAASAVDVSKGGEVIAASRYRTLGVDPTIVTFTVAGDGTLASHGGYTNTFAYYAVGLSPGGRKFGVHEAGGVGTPFQFSVFDEKPNGLFAKVGSDRNAGSYAYSMGVSKNGVVAYVGNFGDGTISIFGDGSTVKCPSPYGFAVTPDGRRLVVGDKAGQGAAANIVTVFGISGTGGLTGP
jgi:DNA-binding beta-propeller fold protein YncE